MTQHCFCLEDATCIFSDGIRKETLYVRNGTFCAPTNDAKKIDCSGLYIAPGLIDLQVNGVAGIDFTAHPEKIAAAQVALARLGTTSFLAAFVSIALNRAAKSLESCTYTAKGANFLGVHLEGPCINSEYAGAHSKIAIERSCDSLKNILDNLTHLKMVTLAPELDGSCALIKMLCKKNIVACCGHSGASTQQLAAAERCGLKMVTHLFNAMKPFHHREPSIIGYTLANKTLHYSLIVDGHHSSLEAVRLAYNAHPDGLVLVSDSSALLAAPEGEAPFELAGRALDHSRPYLKGTSTLAGSCTSLFMCMKLFYSYTGNLHQAVLAASARPAKLLGLETKKGALDIGLDADFVVFTKDLELKSVYVAGCLI